MNWSHNHDKKHHTSQACFMIAMAWLVALYCTDTEYIMNAIWAGVANCICPHERISLSLFYRMTHPVVSAFTFSHLHSVFYIKDNESCINIPWWRHQMESFSALLGLCAGNSPVPVNSPHKGHWRGALMFSLICARINDWVNNREAGDLRRHRGHYDVM